MLTQAVAHVVNFFVNLQLYSLIDQIDIQQLIFIRCKNKTIAPDDSIFAEVVSRIPTLQVSLSNKTLELNQSSVLFIWMKDPWTSAEVEQQYMNQLRQMSINTFQSKFLILQENNQKCEAILRLAWDEYILDITVLEPNEIHHYNPFTDVYLHGSYNISTILFPDKVANLNKYHMKVGVVQYPPYSHAVRRRDGSIHFSSIYGELLQTLSQVANFKIVPEIATMKDYGVLKTDGTATGLIGKVLKGDLDLVAFGAFLFYSPFASLADRTTYIGIEQGCPIVPVIPLKSPRLFLSASVYASVITIVILVVVVYLFSLLLRLDKRLWHPLNVLFLILGISVAGLPKILRERFLYGSIMIVSLFYSSNMVAQLTSISVDTGGNEPFESLSDLDNSGLIPMLHPNLFNITFGFGEDKHLLSLGKKAVPQQDFAEFCPKWLLSSQNVTCVFEELFAATQIKSHKDTEGNDKMKMGKPCFWSITRSFILRRASPFTYRFNQIVRRVEESGIQGPWFLQYFYESKKMQNVTIEDEEEATPEEISNLLKDTTYKGDLLFVIVGSSVSFCVFVAEILIFRVRKWKARAKVASYAN